MSDDFIVWRRPDETWWVAPYNDGAGGVFVAADTSGLDFDLELFREAARDLGVSVADAGYFLYQDLVKVFPLAVLPPNDRRRKGNELQIRDTGEWRSCSTPGIDGPGLDALVNDRKVTLVRHPNDPRALIWLDDGGREEWLAERARKVEESKVRAAQREQRRAQKEFEDRHRGGEHFINPYTFVPLPAQIHRGMPRGHHRQEADAVSGWFTWRLTFVTPLVYPVDSLPTQADGTIRYPGSALRGTLRSLHESLTGGCMRIIDEDYLPVHREPMAAGNEKHTLAVVSEVDPITGAVTEIQLTDELHWIAEDLVHKAVGPGDLHSGCHAHVDTTGARKGPGDHRREIREGNPVSEGSDWVLHLSDNLPSRDKKTYFVAAGHLTGKTERITPVMWQDFQRACAGSQDLIGNDGEPDPSVASSNSPGTEGWPGIDVRHLGGRRKEQPIGRRRKVDGRLSPGDTVWLTGGGNSKHLKMATIWRRTGEHPVRERMDPSALPCHDPTDLCPSCAVFGSVDTRSATVAGRDTPEQAGYASHVRVDWARSTLPPNNREVGIAPLRGPKPSSGGFYLAPNLNNPGRASTSEGHRPHSHWGSGSDEPLRRIRGRKFYWHGQVVDEQVKRQEQRDHQTQDGPVRVAEAGLVLETRVSFDNLSPEQLGWLLAAADPGLFLESPCQVHVGRGKPLGYGSAEPGIVDLHVQTAHSRYGSATDTTMSAAELVAEIRGKSPGHLRETHAALERVLAPDGVPADRIWYPTTENFSRRGQKAFDESFRWFAEHSGARKGDLIPLPEASATDQFLPVHTETDDQSAGQQKNGRHR